MTIACSPPDRENLRSLKRQWSLLAALALAFLTGSFFLLRAEWGRGYAWGWLVIAVTICAFLFADLFRMLGDNRLKTPGAPLFAGLGLANYITIARAVLVAALAGLLVGPWPTGWLAWAPGVLYLAAAVLDFVDGWVARVTGRATLLGEVLDMRWDGAGLLAATLLAVLYGQAPLPYIFVGLVRYLYLLGIWLTRRRGLPIYDLPPGRFRRAMAGMQMGFAAVLILPIFGPPATHLVVILFTTPFLLAFLRDGLWVTGVIRRASAPSPASPSHRGSGFWLPLVLRALLVIALSVLLFHLRFRPGPQLLIGLAAALAIPAVGLGIAGRVVALAVLLSGGFGVQIAPLEWRYWLVILLSALLFMTGTGPYSLWKPEEWLIHKRAGEPR